MLIVADAGPLIALSAIGHLDLLRTLYGTVVVPDVVYAEVVRQGAGRPGSAELAAAAWARIVETAPDDTQTAGLLETLGPGEVAALSLAARLHADLVLIDDLRARNTALRMHLEVRGTLGVLLQGKRAGLVPMIAPLVEQLAASGIWIAERVRRRVIEAAGE